MAQKALVRFMVLLLGWTAVFGVGAAYADELSLIRIDRHSDADRNALIEVGITLIVETNDALFAIGTPVLVEQAAASLALPTTVVDDDPGAGSFALAGLRPGWSESDLAVCGRVVSRGDGWVLLKAESFSATRCSESPGWFLRVLDLEPLKSIVQPPAAGAPEVLAPIPLAQEMVDQVDTAFALSHWAALSESPGWTTRYSRSQGCIDASAYVHDLFSSLGLITEYQHHTSDHADNVIGTLPGITQPDLVYIAIGHLDDLPSSGPAPGADDNASGTAMVTALAEVMSGYCFDRTIKFLAVTGEEQGLYGSDHYADTAATAGENIQAVLNGDMIGWEGDGQPATEDLDVNYNSGSQWLAQAMVDAAADYNTGLTLNTISCPTMTYSDHAPFWDHGWSAICGITDNEGFCGEGGSYPFYHQSSDTIANCGPGGPDFEAAVIRTYLATLAHLAQPVARIPGPPTDLTAQPDGANRIALSWAPQTLGIQYQIYRSTGSCAEPGPAYFIGESSLTSFVDTTASGGVPYSYFVHASAAAGCTSGASACVEATTTGVCTEPPSFAGIDEIVNSAASNCLLDLNWAEPLHVWCGGPVVYNVYRSPSPGFVPSQENRIGEHLNLTTFADHDVIFGESYSYIVRAVDLAHGGEDGNTTELSGSPTGPLAIGTWSDDAGDTSPVKLAAAAPWSVLAGAGVTGAAYATGPYTNDLCAAVTTPALTLSAGPQLSFWSKYDIETGWDKGLVQISTDGGATWQRVPVNYPATVSRTNDECNLGTGQFFNGTAGSFSEFSANLTTWANQDTMLRWIFSSDGGVTGDGWWIDDITISDVAVPSACTGAEFIFGDGFESGNLSAW